MQRVPLSKVKPGMVLARAITNEKGMPLCAEGAELSDAIIERLRRMNVDVVTLKGHPVDLGGEVKTRDERIQEMEARFVRVADDPLMERLKNAIAAAIAGDLEEDEEEDTGETADE